MEPKAQAKDKPLTTKGFRKAIKRAGLINTTFTEDKPLSEKVKKHSYMSNLEKFDVVLAKDVKEAVERAEKRLKERIEDSQYDYANLEHVMKTKVMEIIDDIWKEEIGEFK